MLGRTPRTIQIDSSANNNGVINFTKQSKTDILYQSPTAPSGFIGGPKGGYNNGQNGYH
jgi:hypothetical protein